MSQFNMLTQQLASQSCQLVCFLLSGRSMAVHRQAWLSPEPVQDRRWECVAMSGVVCGRGKWEVPHRTLHNSSIYPQSCMLKMTQVSQRTWTRTTGSTHFWWMKFPYVVRASNSATSPKEEHQTSQCHMFCRQCSDEMGTGGRKTHQSELATVYMQKGL